MRSTVVCIVTFLTLTVIWLTSCSSRQTLPASPVAILPTASITPLPTHTPTPTTSTNVLFDYDTPLNQPIAVFRHGTEGELSVSGQFVTKVAFSPDSSSLATGTWRGIVTIWDILSGGKKAEVYIDEGDFSDREISVVALTYSPDGSLLVAGTTERGMFIWDVRTTPPKIILEDAEPTNAIAFSEEGDLFISGHATGVYLWQTEDFKKLCAFKIDPTIITAVAINRKQLKAYATTLSGKLLAFDINSDCNIVE